jgi:acyl-CoA thioester hydrolase
MSAVFEWLHVVRTNELDQLGHANNEAYLRWMNQAAVAHSAALGWPVEAYFRQGQGWVVRRHEIEYLRPAQPGAELTVRTWVQTIDKASSWRCYAILTRNERVLLARGRTLWAWINYQTGRLSRIPPAVSAAFTVVPSNVFADPA